MTLQYKCNCCGVVVEMQDEDLTPPPGWRAIRTVIEEIEEQNSTEEYESERLHSCRDCNAHMSIEEHLSAEYEQRERHMNVERPPRAPDPN